MVMVADGNEDVARPSANGLRSQLSLQFKIELVHLDMCDASPMSAALRDCEYDVEQDREDTAGHGGNRVGEEGNDGDKEKRKSDQAKPDGNLNPANIEVERHLKIARSRLGVPQHEHRQSIHDETPDDNERVQVRHEGDIATTDEDCQNLQAHDALSDSVARADPGVRLAAPFAGNAIVGGYIEYDDGTH